mgnify:CR=1 FL=1
MFTQPFMFVKSFCFFFFEKLFSFDFDFRYKKIHKQKPVLDKWVEKLINDGVIQREWYEVCIDECTKMNSIIKINLFRFRLKKLNIKRFSMMLLLTRKVQPMLKTKIGSIRHGKASSLEKVLFHILKQALARKR